MEWIVALLIASVGGGWVLLQRAISHHREHERLKHKDVEQNGKLDRIEHNVDTIRADVKSLLIAVAKMQGGARG